MTSNIFNVNGPKGPIEETLMIVLSKINVPGYVPLKDETLLEIKLVSCLHAKASPTILVKMPMRIPSDTGKRNSVLKELSMTEEAVARIQRPEDIPSNPPSKTVELISIVHSIHCYQPSV